MPFLSCLEIFSILGSLVCRYTGTYLLFLKLFRMSELLRGCVDRSPNAEKGKEGKVRPSFSDVSMLKVSYTLRRVNSHLTINAVRYMIQTSKPNG